ncbi:dynein light chain Tctex-type 4-like isoform X1 [Dendroctonus ponderosae]|nr:dynein light chain Tctex-type 4-like isoform X1 [Dendroctonus ponderosae]XP_048523134.1 dynein light chain Tctex-type 4-like isoform X1 [Dendroctonus ponderosae]KAH0999051.1 hypothetical protein HUJ05_006814 [Dendroctonus ponderosae]KAH1015473.1 hypothetical protein HUJ05_013189 [Dendroctonus ponderosae]
MSEPEEDSAAVAHPEENPTDADKPSAPTTEESEIPSEQPSEPVPAPSENPEVENASEQIQPPPPEALAPEKPPDSKPANEESRRRSSMKASIDVTARTMSINQETFMPPELATPAGSVDRRFSGLRRTSLPSGDARRSSIARKSKFGGLSSKARMVLGSIVDIKSNTVEGYDKKAAKYQNTYKMESEKPFNPEKVDKILEEVMQEVMENLQYDPEKCAATAKYASTQIRSKVKQLEFDRYKVVCIVTIGEKNSQDVYATCRFLWDPEKDRYSFYSLENTHVYAIALCFGLYYE